MNGTKKVLITGITGYISQYILKSKPSSVQVIGTARKPLNLPDIQTFLLDLNKSLFPQLDSLPILPDVVLHTAAVSGLGACEKNPEMAERVNGSATRELARWCAKNGVRLIYFSTDIVFKGDRPPYDESSQPDPINVYGRTKLQGELAVQETLNDFAIGRIALSLAPGLNGTRNFIDWFLERLSNKQEIPLFTDEIRTPTFTPELAKRFWQLVLSKETGIFHVCGAQAIDRYQLGRALCDALGHGHDLLKPISLKQMTDYPRPVDVSLVSTRKIDEEEFKIPGILYFVEQLINSPFGLQ